MLFSLVFLLNTVAFWVFIYRVGYVELFFNSNNAYIPLVVTIGYAASMIGIAFHALKHYQK